MSDTRDKITIGAKVKVRAGGTAERDRYERRHLVGTVVDAQELPGYGYGIKIQWPDEESPLAFERAALHQLA